MSGRVESMSNRSPFIVIVHFTNVISTTVPEFGITILNATRNKIAKERLHFCWPAIYS